ncbi:hypothetical protein [Dysgonomonas alginatilytica]|uniref:hypothetical protein n=1 Tax=Dysgonomonas alginatilytica TaxID=1605892 RepID=UPI00147627E1|nr:hypothetical protein [Dysgonomonas alginatilytica]
MKHHVHIPEVRLWLIFSLILTILLTFCFMTCSSNKEKTDDKSTREIIVPNANQ